MKNNFKPVYIYVSKLNFLLLNFVCDDIAKNIWYQYYLFHDVITIVKSTIFKLKIINIYIYILIIL